MAVVAGDIGSSAKPPESSEDCCVTCCVAREMVSSLAVGMAVKERSGEAGEVMDTDGSIEDCIAGVKGYPARLGGAVEDCCGQVKGVVDGRRS